MTDPRVVSTTPSGTEICHAVGVEPAAVSHRCDFPPTALERPAITSYGPEGYAVDIDLLGDIAPDAVVTQAVCGACAVDEPLVRSALEEVNDEPRVVSLEAARLGDVVECVETVGQVFERAERAGRVVDQFRACIDRIETVTGAASERPRVVVLEWLDPLRVAGNWVPELVATAGGRTPLSDPGERSRQIDRDDLRTADPDVIVLAPCGLDAERAHVAAEELRDWPGWGDLPAVQDGRVFTFDGRILSRWTPRLAGELERMAAACHPSLLGGPPAASTP